jgi:hypothetical protein
MMIESESDWIWSFSFFTETLLIIPHSSLGETIFDWSSWDCWDQTGPKLGPSNKPTYHTYLGRKSQTKITSFRVVWWSLRCGPSARIKKHRSVRLNTSWNQSAKAFEIYRGPTIPRKILQDPAWPSPNISTELGIHTATERARAGCPTKQPSSRCTLATLGVDAGYFRTTHYSKPNAPWCWNMHTYMTGPFLE